MTKKTPRVQGTDDITVLKKDEKTTKRIAVVGRTNGTFSTHACDIMSDNHKVIKKGSGSGSDQVAAYQAKGYKKD
jgi:predicted GTPase